jgi:hypothetical protein
MRNQEIEKSLKGVKYLYGLTIFVLVFSGFGQMPIFKRYYLADIPGMAWSADFYITHYMHYLASTLFIALVFYYASGYLVEIRKRMRLTASGWFRVAVVAGLVVSGALLVFRNFPGYHFSTGVIIFLDLSHLGFVMALLFSALYCSLKKKKWTADLH